MKWYGSATDSAISFILTVASLASPNSGPDPR